jgi:hypothetical protein
MAEFTSTVPFTEIYDVTPSDSTDLTKPARALYVGVGGDLKITTIGDTTATMVGVPSGSYVLGQVKRVWATGTTAEDINALL